MAYSGYLIKVGNYTIPTDKFIRAESYKVTMNTNDLDSYRDADGFLHRDALTHKPMKVEFETPPMLRASQMATLMSNLYANFSNSVERKASVTVFNPETNDYVTQDMYMPDPDFTLYGNYSGDLQYSAVRLAFIGY